jgi:hypothetical protein
MSSQQEHLERIRNKVQVLIKQYQSIEKENEKLKADIEKRHVLEQQLRERTIVLEQQLNIIKASSGQLDEASKKDLEKQLNVYIKEIDKCIAMLKE